MPEILWYIHKTMKLDVNGYSLLEYDDLSIL
jgi:hypothetical protein